MDEGSRHSRGIFFAFASRFEAARVCQSAIGREAMIFGAWGVVVAVGLGRD